LSEKPEFYCVDWLRFTVGDLPTAFAFAHSIGGTKTENENASPLPYYSDFRLYDFCRIDWHTLKPEMRVCVTMSGEHLRIYEASDKTIFGLFSKVMAIENLTITRIDLAMDIYDFPLACPREVFLAHKNGHMSTRATTSSVLESRSEHNRPGLTVYIGSRESPRLVRVYDKQAETKTARPWTRIEIEIKKPLAERAAFEVVKYGIIATFKLEFLEFIPHSGVSWIDERIARDTGLLALPVGRKETDKDRWLHETVLPLILDAIRRGDMAIIRPVEGALRQRAEGSHSG